MPRKKKAPLAAPVKKISTGDALKQVAEDRILMVNHLLALFPGHVFPGEFVGEQALEEGKHVTFLPGKGFKMLHCIKNQDLWDLVKKVGAPLPGLHLAAWEHLYGLKS